MQPSQFGPYRVVRRVGQGGMGAVYEAVDPDTGRTVAVKTLPLHLADDEGIRRRFQAEIDTLRTFKHPGIAEMRAWGEEEGLPYFAMEFVPGATLDSLLRSGRRFTWRETTAIAREIVRVLKAAHDHGIVHRDLKPANLMFPPAAGGGFNVKLTDFGIAKLFGETGLTRAGMIVGTPEYMAPEQAAGRPIDHRADLYNLGLVMFAMLAGRPPFQGDHRAVMSSQESLRPPRIASLVPDVPPPLDDLIDRLLAKSPGHRPANAAIVAKMLADVAETPPSKTPATRPDVREQLPTVPSVPRIPGGEATTIVADASVGADAIEPATRRGRASSGTSFTTVEGDARAKREHDRRQENRRLWLASAAALAIIAATIAGGWHLFRPFTADERHAQFQLLLAEKPGALNDLRDAIEDFLARFPDDPRATELHRFDRQLRREQLHRLSRHRLPTYRPKSPAEGCYLRAIRQEDEDPAAAAEELAGLLAPTDPEIIGSVDLDDWQELARRLQSEVMKKIERKREKERQRADASRTDADRVEALLDEARAYADMIASPTTSAADRVIAIVRRHDLLETLVNEYGTKPQANPVVKTAVAEAVAEARRLLAAER